MKYHLVGLFILLGVFFAMSLSQEKLQNSSRLAVLWASGDPDVAYKACFMYTRNAKRQEWFDEVVLIVWGPSARLLAGDKELQASVKSMMDDGILVQACIACADMYGVSQQLAEMGIDVRGMGVPLTQYLKEGWKVLSF